MNFIWGKILETGVYGNKKTYKSLICRFLSSYCPFLSSKFCGERGIRTPGTVIPYVSLANQCTEKISAKIFLHYTASSKSL